MQRGYHYTECGLDNIWLQNGFEFKETPYGRGVSIEDIDGLHNMIAMRLSSQKEPLTPEEVRFLRHEIDVSQRVLGDLLGVGEQTVARWEKRGGGHPITPTAQRLFGAIIREAIQGEGGIREDLERISQIDAQIHQLQKEICLERLGGDEWTVCAA